MRNTALDDRLLSAAEFVRQGACFADIGTDHARLPVFLLSCGRVARAYASDIAEGPLASARQTVAESGVTGCAVLQSDGAKRLAGLGITDYAICGMGGELIVDIIAGASHLFDPAVRLILQPMTKGHVVRAFLAERGFAVLGESHAVAAGRAYVCICAEYTGVPYRLSFAEEQVGRGLLEKKPKTPAAIAYISERLSSLRKEYEGALRASRRERAEALADLIREIETLCLSE